MFSLPFQRSTWSWKVKKVSSISFQLPLLESSEEIFWLSHCNFSSLFAGMFFRWSWLTPLYLIFSSPHFKFLNTFFLSFWTFLIFLVQILSASFILILSHRSFTYNSKRIANCMWPWENFLIYWTGFELLDPGYPIAPSPGYSRPTSFLFLFIFIFFFFLGLICFFIFFICFSSIFIFSYCRFYLLALSH